jgi:hypothetical protein
MALGRGSRIVTTRPVSGPTFRSVCALVGSAIRLKKSLAGLIKFGYRTLGQYRRLRYWAKVIRRCDDFSCRLRLAFIPLQSPLAAPGADDRHRTDHIHCCGNAYVSCPAGDP